MTEPHAPAIANEAQTHLTRARLTLLGVVAPTAITLVGTLLFISWLPELPDPAAVHWGMNGKADGFGNPWILILMPIIIVVLFTGFCAFAMRRTIGTGGLPTFNQKFLAVTGIWFALFLTVGIGGSIGVQRGIRDAADTPDTAIWMLLGLGLGLAAAVLVWFLLPPADRSRPLALPVDELPVAPSERVFWTGVVTMQRRVLLLIVGTLVITLVAAVLAAMNGQSAVVISIAIVVLIVAAVTTTLRWRVSTGAHGFSVVSVLGWPAARIPLADIIEARLIEVNPMADFGGWGWRWAGGRTGIVMQDGSAIEITRRRGRALVVTVDDAETAVAVLKAAQSQQPAP